MGAPGTWFGSALGCAPLAHEAKLAPTALLLRRRSSEQRAGGVILPIGRDVALTRANGLPIL